jgi:hypothetical protein
MMPPNFDETLWDIEELEIWRSMGYKCVICEQYGDTLHEIVPKSKLKDWKRPGNRVVVCADCHSDIHRVGASTWRLRLEIRRDIMLRIYGDKK